MNVIKNCLTKYLRLVHLHGNLSFIYLYRFASKTNEQHCYMHKHTLAIIELSVSNQFVSFMEWFILYNIEGFAITSHQVTYTIMNRFQWILEITLSISLFRSFDLKGKMIYKSLSFRAELTRSISCVFSSQHLVDMLCCV